MGRNQGQRRWQVTRPSQQLPRGWGHSLANGVKLLRLLAALLPLLLDALGHAVPQAEEAASEALVDGVTLPRHADRLLARGCGGEEDGSEAPQNPLTAVTRLAQGRMV